MSAIDAEVAAQVAAIREAVTAATFRYTSERDLHEGLKDAFDAAGLDWRAEVQVVGGRIDFMLGTVGVEVKVKGSTAALRRQLSRYAADPTITHLMVVTTKPVHREVGGMLNTTPVEVVTIGRLSW